MDVPREVSTRLVQVLRIYCIGLHVRSMNDLRCSLASGHYPWLHDELRAALAQGTFAPDEWLRSTGSPPRHLESDQQAMLRQQRQVWSTLFPGHAFPAPPTVAQPPGTRSGHPAPLGDRGGTEDRHRATTRPVRRVPGREPGTATSAR